MLLQELVTRWPFALGSGPFHIKGVSYIAQQRVFASMLPGGLAQLLVEIEKKDADLARFFGGNFLSSQFYDVFALPAVSLQLAELVGKTPEALIEEAAAEQARVDLSGVYRLLLMVTSTRQLIEHMPILINRYYDFAPMRIEALDKGSAHLVREDFPILLDPWSNPTNKGYGEAALRLSGAKDVSIEIESAPNGKTREGLALGDVQLRVRWG